MEQHRKMLKYLKLKFSSFLLLFLYISQWANKFDGKKVPLNIFKTIITIIIIIIIFVSKIYKKKLKMLNIDKFSRLNIDGNRGLILPYWIFLLVVDILKLKLESSIL